MSEEGASRLGFIGTWAAAAFRPTALFSRPAKERSRVGPLWFAVIIGALTLSGSGFVGALLEGKPASSALGAGIGGLVVGPLLLLLSVLWTAGMSQFWLMVVRIKPRPFRETLACAGYATAPLVFSVVPVVGAVIGGVWQIVLLVFGLRSAHRTTRGLATFVTLAGPGASILCALFLRAGVVEAFKIPSGSMAPSVVMGDHIFLDKLAYGPLSPAAPHRTDVMVFKFPENTKQDFIKRAIAMPGDTFEVINGRPILNGWLVPHCYVGPFQTDKQKSELYVEFLEERSYLTVFDEKTDEESCAGDEGCGPGLACRAGICGALQGPFQVAPGETWVMGDNRNNSHDSRSWRGGLGAGVPYENIKGRAMFVWMSFGPAGGVAQDRIWVDILGAPVIPGVQAATLGGALERCLRERPERALTTPPAPGAPQPPSR